MDIPNSAETYEEPEGSERTSMKQKPMLLQRLRKQEHGKGREVIGLIGTHRGVGVTHTALMLTFYMGEECLRKTALLECNEHRDLRSIRDAYKWNKEREDAFSFHRITCYGEVNQDRIATIFNEDYECLILDFGMDFQANREELLRCSTKIIIGGLSEWDIPKLIAFNQAYEATPGSDSWLYFISRAKERTALRISREIGRKIDSVPYIEEPMIPSRITNQFFEKILKR